MARTEWLSEGAEKLAFLPECKDGEFHCDIAIVGSGYGGAVAAAALAGRTEENGRESRVWVLERGNEFVTGAFPERFADLIGQARVSWGEDAQTSGQAQGLFDLRIGSDVSALVGNGLGGGSLINAGVLARPRDEVFRAPWPAGITAAALAPHFAAVEQALGMKQLPPPFPAKLRALQALGAALDGRSDDRLAGIAVTFAPGVNAAGVDQAACIGCGDCFTGCNHRAKNSLAMNYLPRAKRAGARIFTGVTVLTLAGCDGDWWLDWRFTDRQIARRIGAVPRKLRAKRVILAAGAYGSTGILLRSARAGLHELPEKRLGRRFSTNGDMIAAGYRMPGQIDSSTNEGTAPERRHVGPTIAGLVDLRSARVPLCIEELAIPAALRRPLEEIVTTFGMLHGLERPDGSDHRPSALGADPAAVDPDAIRRTAVYATMGDDGAQGRLELAAQREPPEEHLRLDDDMRIAWKDVGECEVFTEAIRVLEEAHAGSGAFLLPNPMWRALPASIGGILDEGPIGGAVFTVHPLGGCAMADSAAEGVVNEFGQVYRGAAGTAVHRTLAVLDGAIVPTALEINPCLTIAALADRAVAQLCRAWGLGAQRPLDPPLAPAAPRAQEPWAASQPTAMRLAEQLRGDLELAAEGVGGPFEVTFKSRLEIEYCEVPDLGAFLEAPAKVMPVARARLHLETLRIRNPALEGMQWQGVVELEGSLRLFEREPSTPSRRVLRAGWAWLRNLGLRALWAQAFRKQPPRRTRATLREMWRGWKALASNVGEARKMIYELTVRRDVLFGHGAQRYRLLAAGDRLRGEKRIAYIAAPLVARDHWLAKLLPWLFRRDRWMSPWDQLTRLPVHLHRGGARKPRRIGLLAVDLPYWVQQFATQLQVARQENQPRAIADLLSFAAYLVRLIGKIHLWSFRAPDYPRRYPWYEFRDPFNDAERAAAAKAAGEAGVELDDRLAERLPGEVEGLERSVVEEPPRLPPQADQQKLRAQIRLTRYGLTWVERRRAPRPPVLLIHGLGASGNTFTLPTVRKPLVKYLVEEGFDPWVLDLRTSIGLASSKRDWTFDETAFTDIPRAIKIVLDRTGARRVHVVAHCIGAAMFSMAALAGKLPTRRIGRVVLSQAGPLMELPPQNRFRGYLASYLKHYLDVDEFDTAASLSRFNRFLDRVLAAYPYPEHETLHHHPLAPWKELTHEAYCVRAYGIYGRLFEHANLNAQTLERLGDYLGHVRYRTYQQTIFYATMRRLTDASGRNRYVTPEKLRRHFRFPVCFLHGARNEVFDVQTARRSFDLLASVFWDPEMRAAWAANLQGRSGYAAYASGRHLRVREIEGYGHQDCMIGARAHRDVYPHISDFLAARSAPARELRALFVVRPPRMGPIVGWTSRRPNGDYVGRMVFVPNDSRSKPLYAMTAVVAPGGKPVPGFGKFHRLRELQDEEPPAQAIDVVLPGPGDYRVLLVTVHREQYEPEPERGLGDGRQDDPFGEDFDRFPPDLPFPKTAAAAEKLPGRNVEIFVQPVLDTCKDLGLDGEPLAPGRRVSDPRYASPVSFAILSNEVLKAGEGDPAIHQDRICFALASCRYAANVADRELADRELGRIRDRLEAPSGALTPQLLVLAGDTIYADATYGIFDPTLGIERYDQRYLEAWTAPNARAVMRRLPVLPMLDDHELEENYDGVRIPRPRSASVEAGMDAFESFALRLSPAFPSPRQPWPVNGRYDYEVTSAGFGFFVMDTRTRRARPLGAGALQASLGEDQLDALEGWLARQHPDKAKFVVSPSVFAPWAKEARGHAAYSLRTDAWDAFPGSLHRVLDFLATRQIRNVIFLSGDYHSSVLCRLTVKKARLRPVTAYSIVSSGLYSPYPFANTLARDLVCEYRGTHRDWLGGRGAHAPCCDTLGDLRIRCTAWPSVSCASFALVSVATDPLGATWLEVEFDEARTPLRRRL